MSPDRSETYEPVPGISEFSLDGTTLTLNIHPDVLGRTDLTAEDEVHDRGCSPETASIRQNKFMAIVGAQEFVDGAADSVAGITVAIRKRSHELRSRMRRSHNMRYVRGPECPAGRQELGTDPWFRVLRRRSVCLNQDDRSDSDARNENYFEEGKPAIQRATHRVIADAQSSCWRSLTIDGSNYPSPTGKQELEQNPEFDPRPAVQLGKPAVQYPA